MPIPPSPSRMDRRLQPGGGHIEDAALMGDTQEEADRSSTSALSPSRAGKTRSLSDGGGTPVKLSPSPLIFEGGRKASKDDHDIRDTTTPVTPQRAQFPPRPGGLSLRMPIPPHGQGQGQSQRDFSNTSPAQTSASPSSPSISSFTQPAPLSPKLDHSHIYASPTNILPRRSRGLDFSRAATSLHHSTLAEQSSPESSPTSGGRPMNIPNQNRPSGNNNDYAGGAEQSTNSLWSMMGNQERMNISSSISSSAHALASDSSSSDDNDLMDEDMDDAYVTTPQINKSSGALGSPAVSSLANFQRPRPRKQTRKKNRTGPLGLGFNPASAATLSKSPPSKDFASPSRRESISWQANQLHISGDDERGGSDGSAGGALGTPSAKRHTIMRQVATRRGNLMPKTKNFARIKHALLEEGAPVESEVRREAEVIRQVRESDMDLEPQPPRPSTAQSSPSLGNQDIADDALVPPAVPPDDVEFTSNLLSSSFKQQVMKNSKGPKFWDTFSETSSIGGTRTTPPPPGATPSSHQQQNTMPRGSSSGMSEDVNMDSPSLGATAAFAMAAGSGESANKADPASSGAQSQNQSQSQPSPLPGPGQSQQQQGPSAAEITRRINGKRRRDDDFDLVSFKRRAVSPGMSVHNSPILQSPLQRDGAPWGSRPGSNGGDKADRSDRGDRGGSGALSDTGSGGGNTPGTTGSVSGSVSERGGGGGGGGGPGGGTNGRVNGGKGRVGFQGMTDANDSLMRMSIE